MDAPDGRWKLGTNSRNENLTSNSYLLGSVAQIPGKHSYTEIESEVFVDDYAPATKKSRLEVDGDIDMTCSDENLCFDPRSTLTDMSYYPFEFEHLEPPLLCSNVNKSPWPSGTSISSQQFEDSQMIGVTEYCPNRVDDFFSTPSEIPTTSKIEPSSIRHSSTATATPFLSRSLSSGYQSLSAQPGGADPFSNICYGALIDISTQILQDPETASIQQKGDSLCFTVESQSNYFILKVEAENIASLNGKVSDALGKLKDLGIRVDAFISKELWIEKIGRWKKSSKSRAADRVLTTLYIYGPLLHADSVGETLSAARLFLQTPLPEYISTGTVYWNPQSLTFPDLPIRDEPENAVPSESVGNTARDIFDLTHQQGFLEEANIDSRVTTPLLSHQKQAVDFIKKKESGTLDESLSLWQYQQKEQGIGYYRHVLNGARRIGKPTEAEGGVLADDMGLGKTLTMLASIVGSLDLSRSFSSEEGGVCTKIRSGKRKASATLIVGPSALILDGWEEEVSRHISPRALRVHKYHGSANRIHKDALQGLDIILTTYATIESDLRRGINFFQSISWYRVILDEAHVIRTRSTKQFAAAFQLTAQMRWCLTGTPIQNRLEDFGSLVTFLKTFALENPRTFRDLITDPTDLKKHDKPDFSNLKRLLGSMCLRRSRHLLKLPEPEIHDVVLELLPAEKGIYETVRIAWKARLEDAQKVGNSGEYRKCFLRQFQSLRMICNHGSHENSSAMMPQQLSLGSEELACNAGFGSVDTCSYCFVDVSTLTAKAHKFGLHSSCSHKLCVQCLQAFEDISRNALVNRSIVCAVCNGLMSIEENMAPISAGALPSLEALLNAIPTKMAKVVHDIETNFSGNKSLVFSAWKRSLDILSMLLQHKGIEVSCIHGQLPIPERRRILDRFHKNHHVRVLLMTFGTGGVGLNLLSVNRIHILEPQWNPAVESQAIGRAVRMGQTRSVTILRYVINGSIETKDVRSKQKRKLILAEGFENQPVKNQMDSELDKLMDVPADPK